MAASLSTIAAKDGNSAGIVGGLQALDLSGAGSGPWSLANILVDGVAGSNRLAITAQNAIKSALFDNAGNGITSTGGALDINVKSGGNENGRTLPIDSSPVVLASQTYDTVIASQTGIILGTTGATGDWLDGILVNPATTTPGNLTVLDGSSTVATFAFGTIADTRPFFIAFGAIAVTAWKVTTGANVSIVAYGNFT